MKSAVDDSSRTPRVCIAHSQLTVDIYSTSRRSPFSQSESFDSPSFPFSFSFFYPFSPISLSPLWEGMGRPNKCDWRVHVCTYVSTHRHVGEKRVRVSRDANYLFYVPTGTPWEVRSSFRVTRSARVRTSAVPNGTSLAKETSEFFINCFHIVTQII